MCASPRLCVVGRWMCSLCCASSPCALVRGLDCGLRCFSLRFRSISFCFGSASAGGVRVVVCSCLLLSLLRLLGLSVSLRLGSHRGAPSLPEKWTCKSVPGVYVNFINQGQRGFGKT